MTRPNALSLMVGVSLVLAVAGLVTTARASEEHPEFSIICKETAVDGKYCKVTGLASSPTLNELKPGELPDEKLTNVQWIAVADGEPKAKDHSHVANPTPEQIREHKAMHPGGPPYCHKWILLNGVWTQVHC